MRSFCRKNNVQKIPRFRGGGVFWVLGGGGGECRFYFYGRADFSDLNSFRYVLLPEHWHHVNFGSSDLQEIDLSYHMSL